MAVISQQSLSTLCVLFVRSMPITRSGLIQVHGPVSDCCPSSRNPPSGPPVPSNQHPFSPSRSDVKILKRVPCISRDLYMRKLATILDEVVKVKSTASWDCIICSPAHCLRAPKREGHHRALASLTNQLIEEEGVPELTQTGPQQRSCKPPQQLLESPNCFKKRVTLGVPFVWPPLRTPLHTSMRIP